MFKRKIKVTLLNFKWEPIIRLVKVNSIPRSGEFIYIKEGIDKYFEVLNVVHDLSNEKETFIIVKEYNRDIKSVTD